jgi:RNA polymerase sigma-70 factor (ECF subfamily)
MQISEPSEQIEAPSPRLFATTHWTVVLTAGAGASETAGHALEQLCEAYWHPIYSYLLRRGYSAADAQDLTQEFFAQVIAKRHLRHADHSKGKFRSFLLASLHYFLAREWCRAHRQKRGGQYQFVSLDEPGNRDGGPLEPAAGATPEKEFQRQWALTVLNQAMDALENECAAANKSALFCEVKHLLAGERDGESYRAIGSRLGMSQSALRVTVHRLRQRYGQLLRSEIQQTVGSRDQVEEELNDLLRALSE